MALSIITHMYNLTLWNYTLISQVWYLWSLLMVACHLLTWLWPFLVCVAAELLLLYPEPGLWLSRDVQVHSLWPREAHNSIQEHSRDLEEFMFVLVNFMASLGAMKEVYFLTAPTSYCLCLLSIISVIGVRNPRKCKDILTAPWIYDQYSSEGTGDGLALCRQRFKSQLQQRAV